MEVRQSHCERSERATENPENGSGRKFYILWIWAHRTVSSLVPTKKMDNFGCRYKLVLLLKNNSIIANALPVFVLDD